MKALLTLFITATTCLTLVAADADTWVPADHPATISHRIAGLTHPSESLTIASEFAGRVTIINVSEGDIIQASQAWTDVVLLDDALAVIAAEQAAARVAEAEASVALAESQLAVAAREAEYQAGEYQRINQLVAAGRLTEREGEAQRFLADSSRLAHEAQQAQVTAAKQMVISARAVAADAIERQSRHRISAPAGWTVSDRLVEPGAFVSPGQPILVLHDVRNLDIRLQLTATEIAALQQASALTVFFPDYDHQATATIDRIDVRADPTTRKRTVYLTIAGEDAPVASGGLNSEVFFEVPLGDGTVVVPSEFIIRGRQRAFVELSDGTRQAVVPLQEHEGMVIIDGAALAADATLLRPGAQP